MIKRFIQKKEDNQGTDIEYNITRHSTMDLGNNNTIMLFVCIAV